MRLLVVIALSSVVAVGGAGAAGSSGLTANTWKLTELSGSQSAPKGATAEFTAAGKVSGFAGCNTFGGSYTTTRSSISISKLTSTLMACAPSVMKAETAYLGALASAKRFSVSGDALKLKSRVGRTLANFGVQSQSLAGTKWLVTGYNNGKQAVVSPTAGTKLTAAFGQTAVTGSAGCNSYDAPLKTTPPKVEVGAIATTRKYCSTPAGIMDQEAAYLAALGSAATYTVQGGKLELRTANDQIAVTMQHMSG
jgi:heat shock protein HslJ